LREPDTPVIVQMAAVAALSRMGYRDAISLLRPLARHQDIHLRLFAARALAEFGEPVDEAMVAEALGSDDYVVRLEAAEVLGATGAAGAAGTLRSMARNDFHGAVRDAATQALLRQQLRGKSRAGQLAVLRGALEGATRGTALWVIQTMLAEGGKEGRAEVEALGAKDNRLGERCRAHLVFTSGNLPANSPAEERP